MDFLVNLPVASDCFCWFLGCSRLQRGVCVCVCVRARACMHTSTCSGGLVDSAQWALRAGPGEARVRAGITGGGAAGQARPPPASSLGELHWGRTAGVRIWGHKQEPVSPSGKPGHSLTPATPEPHWHPLGPPCLARPQRGWGGPRGSPNTPARSTRAPSARVPTCCPPQWAPRGRSHHSSLSQAGGSEPAAGKSWSPGPGGGTGEPSGRWPHLELFWGYQVDMTARPVLSTPKPQEGAGGTEATLVRVGT